MYRKGFTLIELLVVIAIIGILAAIIFPVFARVRVSAYKSSDMSNMNALRTALQLYRQDQGGYPPALLGYVSSYDGAIPPTSAADVMPANQLVGALYPKRVDSLETFRPAYDRLNAGAQYTAFTEAYWPAKSGASDPLFPSSNGVQEFGGVSDGYVERCYYPGTSNQEALPNYYYQISGYDVANVQNPAGGSNINEIHYSPFWSNYTVATDPCTPTTTQTGSSLDSPRQLGYYNPPESTVVTWDSNFRDYENGVPLHEKTEIVLFEGGYARPYDSALVAANSWMVTP